MIRISEILIIIGVVIGGLLLIAGSVGLLSHTVLADTKRLSNGYSLYIL